MPTDTVKIFKGLRPITEEQKKRVNLLPRDSESLSLQQGFTECQVRKGRSKPYCIPILASPLSGCQACETPRARRLPPGLVRRPFLALSPLPAPVLALLHLMSATQQKTSSSSTGSQSLCFASSPKLLSPVNDTSYDFSDSSEPFHSTKHGDECTVTDLGLFSRLGHLSPETCSKCVLIVQNGALVLLATVSDLRSDFGPMLEMGLFKMVVGKTNLFSHWMMKLRYNESRKLPPSSPDSSQRECLQVERDSEMADTEKAPGATGVPGDHHP